MFMNTRCYNPNATSNTSGPLYEPISRLIVTKAEPGVKDHTAGIQQVNNTPSAPQRHSSCLRNASLACVHSHCNKDPPTLLSLWLSQLGCSAAAVYIQHHPLQPSRHRVTSKKHTRAAAQKQHYQPLTFTPTTTAHLAVSLLLQLASKPVSISCILKRHNAVTHLSHLQHVSQVLLLQQLQEVSKAGSSSSSSSGLSSPV
jgi:hypothetical protein